jgi:hypothetical protein
MPYSVLINLIFQGLIVVIQKDMILKPFFNNMCSVFSALASAMV